LAFREFAQLHDQELQADAQADSKDQWHKLLRHLAFVMMQGKTLIDPQLSISREEAEDCLTAYLQHMGWSNPRECAERWLKDLLKYHLIQPVIQPNLEEHIEFRHQLIQEYYTAEYLLRLLPNLTNDQLKQDYLNYLKWTEPIALMLALTDEETQAVRVVKLAVDQVDLMLGARLAGEVKDVHHTATLEQIDRLEISLLLKIQCWAASYSAAAIPRLLKALDEDPEIAVRVSAAEALGQFCGAAAISGLFKALEEDPEITVRASVTYALLGQLECQLQLQLFDQLDSQDEDRWALIHELINLSQAALEEDPEITVSESVAKAFGQLFRQDESSWILKLLKALFEAMDEPLSRELRQIDQFTLEEDPGSTVFESVTKVFGQLLSQDEWSWILKLLEAIEYRSSYERQHLLELSRQSGSKTNFTMVLIALKEEQGDTFHALLKALEHQDADVRLEAAGLLRYFGSPLPLAVLWKLHYQQPDNGLWESIFAIQSHCQFYNYEIFQAHLAAQKADRPTNLTSDRPITYEVNAEVVQIVENNYGTIHGKQTP